MAKQKYSIAVLQLNLNNTPENNLQKCKNWVRKAAVKGAEVILLPELYSSHYFCQSEDVGKYEFAKLRNRVSFQVLSVLGKNGVVRIVLFFKKRMIGYCFEEREKTNVERPDRSGFFQNNFI